MSRLSTLTNFALALCAGLVGCAGAPSSSREPAQAAAPQQDVQPANPHEQAPVRPTLTAQACEASGGSIVGDIGDGAIHRPEYRCPNGAKPTGSIQPAEGGPIAIEGSVCCPH